MSSASFARAEAAWMEPPEPHIGTCVCGDSIEDHADDGNDVCCAIGCDCTEFTEYTAEQARWDAESEAGDAIRKEAGLDD